MCADRRLDTGPSLQDGGRCNAQEHIVIFAAEIYDMRMSYLFGLALVAGTSTATPPAARAQADPNAIRNPAPTARSWADLAHLPDLSGVWTPGPLDKFAPGTNTAPPWTPEIARQVAALQALEAQGRPQNIY